MDIPRWVIGALRDRECFEMGAGAFRGCGYFDMSVRVFGECGCFQMSLGPLEGLWVSWLV